MPQPDLPAGAPPILQNAGTLLSRYDAVFCDVWGVVHNGITAYTDACDALANLPQGRRHRRAADQCAGPRAPRRNDVEHAPRSAGRMGRDRFVRRNRARAYDRAGLHLRLRHRPARPGRRVFRQGGRQACAVGEAQAIVATGLDDDRSDVAEDYRPLLEDALQRRLPFVCANPDLVVDVGGTLYLCAGRDRRCLPAHGRRGVLGRKAAFLGLPHRACSGGARSRHRRRPRPACW